MTDIIARLSVATEPSRELDGEEAAAELTHLTAEVARLREALVLVRKTLMNSTATAASRVDVSLDVVEAALEATDDTD